MKILFNCQPPISALTAPGTWPPIQRPRPNGNSRMLLKVEPVRAVVLADRAVHGGVARVQETSGIHRLRKRVAEAEGGVPGEALLGADLQGVIPGVADRLRLGDIAEFGVRPQQVGDGDGLRVNGIEAVRTDSGRSRSGR